MKTIFKRATALLLSLLMVFSVCSTSLVVFAQGQAQEKALSDLLSSLLSENQNKKYKETEKDHLIYVSIGDSMTNGYGIEGYDGESGILNYGNDSYANQFAAYLAGCDTDENGNYVIKDDQIIFEGSDTVVEHRQLAMSGLRPEDLNFLLSLNLKDSTTVDKVAYFGRWPHQCTSWETNGWEPEWTDNRNGMDYTGREYFYSLNGAASLGLGMTAGDSRTFGDLLNESYRLADGAARVVSRYKDMTFEANYVKVTDEMIEQATAGLANSATYPNEGTTSWDTWSDEDVHMLFGKDKWLGFATEFYQESIADADVITMAMGNTNFGTWMFDQMKSYLKNTDAKNMFTSQYYIADIYRMADAAGIDKELLDMIEDLIESEIDPILNEQFAALANLPLSTATSDNGDIYNAYKTDPNGNLGENATRGDLIKYIVKYCTLSYLVNYIIVIDRIVAMNPDVDLIQIAMINAYDTGKEYEGEDMSMAEIIDMLYTPLNAFLTMLPDYLASKNSEKYAQADFYFVNPGRVETLSESFGDDFYVDAQGNRIPYPGLDLSKVGGVNPNASVTRDRFQYWISGRRDGRDQVASHFYFPSGGDCSYGEMWKHVLDELFVSNASKKVNSNDWYYHFESHDNEGVYGISGEHRCIREDTVRDFFGTYDLMYMIPQDLEDFAKLSESEIEAKLTGDNKSERDWAFSMMMYLMFENAIIESGKNNFSLGSVANAKFDYTSFDDAFSAFAKKLYGNASVDYTYIRSNPIPANVKILDVFKMMSDALVADPTASTVLCLGSRVEIGSGIGGHTSENGHNTVFAAIKRDVLSGNTGDDLTKAFLMSYLTEKYPELMKKLGAVSALGETDDLARIVMMLKIAQKNGNTALANIDLDAIEDAIRAKLLAYQSAHTVEQQAAAQAAAYDLMKDLQALAAKVTAVDYKVTESSYYVSLGDSNINGYGLEGYTAGTNGGFGQKLAIAAPGLVAQELFGTDWQKYYDQYAMGSLRSEDLLYLLGGENVVVDDYYTDEVEQRVLANFADIEAAQKAYVAAVQKADLITIALGGGNVTTFTGEQIDRVTGKDAKPLVAMDWSKIGYTDAAIAELQEFIKEMVPLMDTLGLMNKYVPEGIEISNPAAFAATLLESMLYGYASYNYYYPQVIARIREINPDAQLVIIGMFNPIDDWTMEMNGKIVNIGGIVNNVMEMTNIQNLAYALQNANTTYVDIHATETILEAEKRVAGTTAETTFVEYYKSILEGNGEDAHASENGHQYMAAQIYANLCGVNVEREVGEIVKDFYNILKSDYATIQEKLSMIGKTYALLDEKKALDNYPEVKAIADVYAFLDSKNYITDEQALDIVLMIYGQFFGKIDMIAIADHVYGTLLINTGISHEAKIEIIAYIYNVLEADTDYLDPYAKPLAAIEAIVALDALEKVTAKQAFALVNHIYTAIIDGEVSNAELRTIVNYAYFTILSGTVQARSAINADDLTVFTAAEKLTILEGVVDVLFDHGYINDSITGVTEMMDLYEGIKSEDVLDDAKIVSLIDKAVKVYVDTEVLTDDVIVDLAKEVVVDVMNDPAIPADKKVILLNKVVDTFEKIADNSGVSDILPEIPEIPDLTVANEILAKLEAEGLLTHDQANAIIGEATKILVNADYSDLAAIADEVFNMFVAEGFTVEQTAKIAVSVVEFLIKEGYADKAIDTYVQGYYEIALNYVLTTENKAAAIYYIDLAINAVNAALAEVQAYDTTFAQVKAALVEELLEVLSTLDEAKKIINSDLTELKVVMKTIIGLKDDLDRHVTNVSILANELGIAGNYVIGQLISAAQNYQAIANNYLNIAYEWVVDNTKAVVDGYYTLVDQIGAVADKIDPALGTAVRQFMLDTPAEAIALIALYGENAVDTLCTAAVKAVNDLYTAAVNLAAVLKNHGIAIYSAIVNDPTCKALQDQIEALNVQLQALTAAAAQNPGTVAANIYAQIDEIKAQLTTLAEMFYDAALAAVEKADPIASEALEDALDALTDAAGIITGAAGNYAEWLAGQASELAGKIVSEFIANWNEFAGLAGSIIYNKVMGILETLTNPDTYESILDKIVEEALKVAPQLDAKIYEYLNANNPEFVEFVERHESYLVRIANEYGTKALGAIGVALATYGPELAQYLIDNADVILAGIVEFVEKHNVQIVAILQIYAEYFGVCDKISAELNILSGKLAQLQAEITKQLNIINNEICPEITELNEQLKTATEPAKAIILEQIKKLEEKKQQIEQYIAEVQASVVKVRAAMADIQAKQQVLVVELQNLGAALQKLAIVGVEEGFADVQKALGAVAYAIRDIVNVVSGNLAVQIDNLLAQAKDFLDKAYGDATSADYIIDRLSSLVALGDNKAAADLFAAALTELVAEKGYTYRTNTSLVENGSKINTIFAQIAKDPTAIAKADLISIAYSYDKIAEETMCILLDLILNGQTSIPTAVDWNALVGYEIAQEIIALLAEIKVELDAAGLDITLKEFMGIDSNITISKAVMTALEYFAYYAVEYAVVMPQAINYINQINPEALIMINAINNPVSGASVSVKVGDIAFDFSFGDYLDYVVDAIYVESVAVAAIYDNVVFAPTTDVDTTFTDKVITLNDLMSYLKDGHAVLAITTVGNADIATKMVEALNITVVDGGLLGDVNSDGVVDYVDAICILEYDARIPVTIDLSVGDVDGNGIVNYNDAVWVLEYDAGLIVKFPAAN